MTNEWYEKFVVCFEETAERIATGQQPVPMCTAEEMVMHLTLDFLDIRDMVGRQDELLLKEEYSVLPAGFYDGNWDALRGELFADSDVLVLFDPPFDGVESTCLEKNSSVTNLEPEKWFLPFGTGDRP